MGRTKKIMMSNIFEGGPGSFDNLRALYCLPMTHTHSRAHTHCWWDLCMTRRASNSVWGTCMKNDYRLFSPFWLSSPPEFSYQWIWSALRSACVSLVLTKVDSRFGSNIHECPHEYMNDYLVLKLRGGFLSWLSLSSSGSQIAAQVT